MCVVSMIGDSFSRNWKERYPEWDPNSVPVPNDMLPKPGPMRIQDYSVPVSRTEFEQLRREVELLKSLLKDAAEYDKRNNEPHCETDEKIELLRAIAKAVGVDLSEVFPEAPGKD